MKPSDIFKEPSGRPPALLVATKLDILSLDVATEQGQPKHDRLLNPNQVVFVPKPNQTIRTLLSRHNTENRA